MQAFVSDLQARQVTPNITVNGAMMKTNKVRKTAIDGYAMRHAGYAVRLRGRKRREEVFGRIEFQAGVRKVKLKGRSTVGAPFTLAVAACDLVCLPQRLARLAT